MQWPTNTDVKTESGLRLLKPKTFVSTDVLERYEVLEDVRNELRTVGIAVINGVLSESGVEKMKTSVVNDVHESLAHFRLQRFLETAPVDRLTQFQLEQALQSAQSPVLPPFQHLPVDGVFSTHRIPLTIHSQLRRLHPTTRAIFSRIYSTQVEDLCARPDSFRALFHEALAERSSKMPFGLSMEQEMFRKLNGSFQPPHRLTGYQGYQTELSRRLGDNCPVDYGIMGLLNLTTSHTGPVSSSGTVRVGPGFVAVPYVTREAQKRTTFLDMMATPQAARRAALSRYDELTDDDLDSYNDKWTHVLVEKGSLLLWRRDIPIAFNIGECAEPTSDPYELAYAAQAISWVPRYTQLPKEKYCSVSLFRSESDYRGLYEMRAPTYKQAERKIRKWGLYRKRKKDYVEMGDVLNDTGGTELLKIQKEVF